MLHQQQMSHCRSVKKRSRVLVVIVFSSEQIDLCVEVYAHAPEVSCGTFVYEAET